MTSTLRSLLADPFFYGLLVAVGGAIAVFARLIAQSAVDHQFARRIESHKHDLQLVAEHVRFEHQTRLAGASLYLQKQHSAAAEVYAAIRVAHGYVSRLFGVQRTVNLEDCNEIDLREIMQKYQVLDGKQTEIISVWHRNRREGSQMLQEHLVAMRIPLADNKMQEARNLMYLNEIYFSDDVIIAMDEFVSVCNEWLVRATFPPEHGQQVKVVSREELDAALEKVHTALRAEIATVRPLPTPPIQHQVDKMNRA